MTKVVHAIEQDRSLWRLLRELLEAYTDRTRQWSEPSNESGNSQVLEAINNLTRKVDEFMATQEERLRGIQTKLDSVATGIDTLQQQVADLKANNPDMEDEIAGLEATVQRIADDISGASAGGSTGGGEGGGAETTPEPTPDSGGGTR